MAIVEFNHANKGQAVRRLESVTITNQTATTSAIAKAVQTPEWASYATFILNLPASSMAGTTPLLDFKLEGVDPYDYDAASIYPIGGWDGITQLTAATARSLHVVEIGPGVTGIADDDTGSATATDRYAINAPLPFVILYTITTDGTTDDEDYIFTLSVQFRA